MATVLDHRGCAFICTLPTLNDVDGRMEGQPPILPQLEEKALFDG